MSGAGWRRVPGGQTLAGFLTALVLLSVAWPIHRAEWVQKMPSLPMVVVVSVALAGVLIGRRWTWRRAHGLTALLGVLGDTGDGVKDVAGHRHRGALDQPL